MLRPIAILLLIPALSFGALPATTVWEIRTDGSPTNGGGYKSNAGTTDYSQQAAAQLSVSDAACAEASATTITSATGGFTAAMVGNICYIGGGSNFTAGWYEITGYTDTNTITIDRDPTDGDGGDGSSGTCNVGGALKCLGDLGAIFQTAAQSVAGMKAYVRGGTYSLSGTTANIDGGPLDLDASQQDGKAFYIKGYDPAEGRDEFTGTRPIIDCNGNAPTNVILLKGAAVNEHLCAFLHIDAEVGGGAVAVNGFVGTNNGWDQFVSCIAEDCDGSYAFRNGKFVHCLASACLANGFDNGAAFGCRATGCEIGFNGCPATHFCIADAHSSDGFNSVYTVAVNCVAYGNGGDGFDCGRGSHLANCIAWSNAYSFRNGVSSSVVLLNCAGGSHSSGRTVAAYPPYIDLNPVTLTEDPFTNAAGGIFTLDPTAAEYADLVAGGFSPYGQTSYIDIGAVQHADPGGGGGETSHVWVR